MNNQVDKYLAKQKPPQREICLQLRRTIHATFPGIEEEMKWGVPTYAKGKFYIVAMKDHVNLGFSMEGLSENERRHFDGSGKTMRILGVSSLKDIAENEIVKLLKLVWERQKAKME